MNPSLKILKSASDDFYMVRCAFLPVTDGAKTYTYKAQRELQLRPGDYAVVQARGEFGVVKVLEVDSTIPWESDMQFKWVVDRIEYDRFLELLDREQELQDEPEF